MRVQCFECLLDILDLNDDPDRPLAGKHQDLGRTEILRSETAVQSVISAIQGFTNPFNIIDKTRLYSLASGAPVPENVARDVLGAEDVGKEAKMAFIAQRMANESSSTSIFDPIKRNKLKTMDSCNKTVKLISSQGKVMRRYLTCYDIVVVVAAYLSSCHKTALMR